jgi:hypothetical protein
MVGENLGMFAGDKKRAGEHQSADNSFLTLIQVVQKYRLNSTVGTENCLSSPVALPNKSHT